MVSDRFNPARNTIVFTVTGEPESPPTNAERRTYLKELQTVAASDADSDASSNEIAWRKFMHKAEPEIWREGASWFCKLLTGTIP